MSGWNWFWMTITTVLVLWWMENWYQRLEAAMLAKLKLDESQADALDRICGRLEASQQEIAEANADYDGDEWTTVDGDSDDDDSDDGDSDDGDSDDGDDDSGWRLN